MAKTQTHKNKKILIFLFLCLLLFFLSRDYFIKIYFLNYIKNKFGLEASIGNVDTSFKGIIIKDFDVKTKFFNFKTRRVGLFFDFSNMQDIRVSSIYLKGLAVKINDFDLADKSLRLILSKINIESKGKEKIVQGKSGLRLDLKDISVEAKGKNDLYVDVAFSFLGSVKSNRLNFIEAFTITRCNVKTVFLNIDFDLRKEKAGSHVLNISNLIIKDKEIKDIKVDLLLGGNEVLLTTVYSDFLGPLATVSGILDISNYKNVCLSLYLKDVSFKRLTSLLAKDDSVVFRGGFTGNLGLCLKGTRVSRIEGDILNLSGGVIDVKKEASLSFLRKYLDESSYQALVDNLKHYTYNKGRMKVSGQGKSVLINMDFNSEDLGKRSVTVNFRGILEGIK